MHVLSWTKVAAMIAFVVIAIVSVYDGFADEMDFPSIVVILISTGGAIGFALSLWTDKKEE